ncbi:hypothetical protein WN55_10785, partial [Dufourea novaeangliae]
IAEEKGSRAEREKGRKRSRTKIDKTSLWIPAAKSPAEGTRFTKFCRKEYPHRNISGKFNSTSRSSQGKQNAAIPRDAERENDGLFYALAVSISPMPLQPMNRERQ